MFSAVGGARRGIPKEYEPVSPIPVLDSRVLADVRSPSRQRKGLSVTDNAPGIAGVVSCEEARDAAHGATVDRDQFRATLSHFASGLVVLTGSTAGTPSGMTCQSFFSLSMDPPLVAIAPGRASNSWPRIAASGAFCANVLSSDQEDVCRTFARSGHDKFADVSWSAAPTGSPRIDGALAWIDCRIRSIYPAGDHYLVVGAIVDMGIGNGDPLVFFRSRFASLGVELAGSGLRTSRRLPWRSL